MNPTTRSRSAFSRQRASLMLATALAFGISPGLRLRAFAHAGGHDMQSPIDADQVLYNAMSFKEMLVDTKKLDKSWLDVKRLTGAYVAANHTGK